MSITDPSAEPAQPDEGQGSEASGGSSPWEQHLTRFPDDQRDEAASVFREMEGDFTRRFQDAADFRKQWEPLKDTGVNQLSPDEVAWLVQFRGALDDPNVMQQWWDGYAQENGLTQSQQAQQEPAPLDDFGGFQDPQQLQSLIDQATGPLKQQLEQMQGHIEQQQQQQQLTEANQYVERQMAELEQKHGKLDDDQREALAVFAGKFADSDPMNAIPRGYDAMVKFVNGIEKSSFQSKVDAPAAAEAGGVADVNVPQFKTVHDDGVKNAAIEFLRNNNRA